MKRNQLTIPQLAAVLKVSESTARRMVLGRPDVRDVGLGRRKHLRIPESVAQTLRTELFNRR